MLNPRKSKTISFRMTDREYEQLMDLCYMHGARSASEGARYAIETLVHRSEVPQNLTLIEQIRRVELKIAQLEGRMQDISHLIATIIRKNDPDFAMAGRGTGGDD